MRRIPRWLVLAIAGGLLGCGGGEGETPTTGVPGDSSQAPPPEAPTGLVMQDHYGSVIRARDALMRGDLDAFRVQLAIVPALALGPDSPEAWDPFHAQLQQVAGAAAEAGDRDAAGRSFAAVVLACASCHSALAGGSIPAAPAAERDAGAPQPDHALATRLLWEGVTAPRDDAWERGAATLAAARVVDTEGESAVAGMAMLEGNLRAIGEAAGAARAAQDRALIYARLAASCGDCHGAAGPLASIRR